MMRFSASCCILSKFYIKPQQVDGEIRLPYSCILSKFYIKPQPLPLLGNKPTVVSYRNSTSNHNNVPRYSIMSLLYLIEILHQTTTSGDGWGSTQSCILSKFYIKPQRCILYNILGCGCILSKFYIKPQRASF